MSLTFVKTVSRITGQGNLLAVSDQVTWIKGMGVYLIIVTKKNIKTVLLRNASCSPSTNSPLSESTRDISSCFQHTSQGRFICPNRRVPVINSHRHVAGMQSRK